MKRQMIWLIGTLERYSSFVRSVNIFIETHKLSSSGHSAMRPLHMRLQHEEEDCAARHSKQGTIIPLQSHHCFNSEPIVGGSSKWDKKPLICVANSSVITSVSTDTTSSHFLSERSWLILTRNRNAGFPAPPFFIFFSFNTQLVLWSVEVWKYKTQLFNKITDAPVTCLEDKENIKTWSCNSQVEQVSILSFTLQ